MPLHSCCDLLLLPLLLLLLLSAARSQQHAPSYLHLALQGMTALALVRYAYEVKAGDWVLIHAAAGGTGQQLTQFAAQAGAHVIGTVSTPEKAELAKSLGAEHVILYTKQV